MIFQHENQSYIFLSRTKCPRAINILVPPAQSQLMRCEWIGKGAEEEMKRGDNQPGRILPWQAMNAFCASHDAASATELF